MQFGDILVCMDGSATGQKRTELALAFAKSTRARLIGYHLTIPRRGLPFADFLDTTPRSEELEAAAMGFEQQVKVHGLDGTWIRGSVDRRVEDIGKYARCVDLVIVGLGPPDDPEDDPQGLDVEALVVECGRPVLGIPVAAVSDTIGANIMVAWDGSRESARALHDAIPFLREAATIKVVSIDSNRVSASSPDAVVAHLGRLGINANIDISPDLGWPAGEEILGLVEQQGIDLLVAGAFGHSRLREHLVGGASRTLIHQMMVPVLVSH